MLEESVEQTPADPLSLVRRGDGHFVNPEVRSLVGVYVMDRRRHADHALRVDRDREVMARVSCKLRAPAIVDGAIEDIWRNPTERGYVTIAEQADLDGHRWDTGVCWCA